MNPAGRLAAFVAFASLAGCAIQGPPPGGPPDRTPPHLIGIVPDSGSSVPTFSGSAAFLFDEVVFEGGTPNFGLGTGDLEKLIILSPSKNVPVVRWLRRRIAVRPKEGWKPNTTYRIELLPGIADVRGNRGAADKVLTFTTAAEMPHAVLRGSAYDWNTAQPLRGGLVEAILLPDTTMGYRSIIDSSGKFVIGDLPQGTYLVYAIADQNRNLRRDAREQFDSVRVGPDSLVAGELWTFPHDTTGPRMQTAQRADSVSATLTFSQPLDPRQVFDTSMVRVRKLPDSTAVAIRGLFTTAARDSMRQTERPVAPRDTTHADSARVRPRDSVPIAPPRPGATVQRASRLPLYNSLVLVAAAPWDSGGKYVIDIRGIRNVNRVAADARNVLAVTTKP